MASSMQTDARSPRALEKTLDRYSAWARSSRRIAERFSLECVSKNAYSEQVKSSEFKRWLTAQGATFEGAKGSHLRVKLNGKTSFLPMHSKELKTGLVEGIKKQLGLK